MLSDNLDEQLVAIKVDPKFYLTSYFVYLLVARTTTTQDFKKMVACKMLMHDPMWYVLSWSRRNSQIKEQSIG